MAIKLDHELAKEWYENLRPELKSKVASSEDNLKLIELYKKATEKFVAIDKKYFNSNLERKSRIIRPIFEK